MASLRQVADVAPRRVARTTILVVIGLIFAIPLIAMLEFTFRTNSGYSLDHWTQLIEGAFEQNRAYRGLVRGIGTSVLLAVMTVVLIIVVLVPTMILVRLQAPRLERALELVCILPITIPAIVLVVGLAPVYRVVGNLLGSAPWTLCFVYGIIALPYAYRAVQSSLQLLDVRTLADAARSLGASWPTVIGRVIIPNIRRGVLAASIITVAIVLGEYTIAGILGRGVLQTALVEISQTNPFAAVAVSFLSLVLAFILLLIIGGIGRDRKARS